MRVRTGAPVVAISFSLSLLALLATQGVAAAQESADPVPYACVTETTYDPRSKEAGYAPTSATSYQVAGPGTISYTKEQTAEHEFSVNASFSVSASAIIATAEAEFGVGYAYSSSKSDSWTYQTTIPAGKTGRQLVLHRADEVYVNKVVWNANCTTTVYRNAIATIPRSAKGSLDYCVIRDFKPYRTQWQTACAGE